MGNIRQKLGKCLKNLSEKLLKTKHTKIKIESGEKSEAFFLLPEEYRECFEISQIEEKAKEWIIDCKEKEDQIPEALKNKEYKKNGQVESTEIIHYPLTGKPCYLHFYRQKWKDKKTGEIYTNSYKLHAKGMKCTAAFGDFLKGFTRQERSEFHRAFPDLRINWEQTASLVQRSAQ